MSALNDITVECTIVLGSTTLPVRQVLKMSRGAMIPLDRNEDDPTLLYMNGQLVARGHITVDGDRMLLEISELVSGKR